MDMNSRLYNFTRIIGVLTLALLVSCQDTIPKRSLISAGSTVTTPECEDGQELVTETQADGTTVQVCKSTEVTRPAGVTWAGDYCICKDTKPVSYGDCTSVCATKNTNGAEVLYATFKLSDELLLNDDLKTLSKWCTTPLATDTTNPACVIQAKDEAGTVTTITDVTISTTTNTISTNVDSLLSYDKTYLLTLVEKTSGVKSDSVQIIKFSSDLSLGTLGPLKNVPVSQYSCILRQTVNGSYTTADRLHYYYNPAVAPDPIITNSLIFCHDIQLHPGNDKEEYPRMENTPGIFNLWDTSDPRFYDNNGNKLMDINEAIVQKTKNFGATIPASSTFFYPFTWQTGPVVTTDSSSSGSSTTTVKNLGYFMAPWIDSTTYKSYCLNSTHYNSSNALFKAMRDYIGVDTEGLYIGSKAAETIDNADGTTTTIPQDVILIRETDLKAVWFYYKNSVPTAPTDDNVASNTIYFYYPLNKASPFVKTSTQRLFRVKTVSELASGSVNTPSGSTSSGSTTSYQPHDRKIGCIPKF